MNIVNTLKKPKSERMPSYRKFWRENVTKSENGKFLPTFPDMMELALLKAYHCKTNRDKVGVALDIISETFTPLTIKHENGWHDFYPWINIARVLFNDYVLSVTSDRNKKLAHKFFAENEVELNNYKDFTKIVAREIVELEGDRDSDQEAIQNTKYSYFYVRDDLSPEQKIVQTAHAALNVGTKINKKRSENLHFVMLQTVDQYSLEHLQNMLASYSIPHEVTIEPDLNDSMTVVATHPVSKRRMSRFIKYPLLKLG